MLKQLILPFLILFCGSLCFAQSKVETSKIRSHYNYVYKLTDTEAETVYKNGSEVVGPSYFHTLTDSFTVAENYTKKLPQGHYLFMHSNGPDLVYTLTTYTSLAVKLLQIKPALAILVHDSLGNIITDAEVRVNNKKASFDPATKTYRLKKTPKDGFLSVSRNNFTLYQNLEKKEENTYVIRHSVVKRIIHTVPIRYTWRPFYDAFQSMRRFYPVGWVRSIFSIFDDTYRETEKKEKYRGYMVFNKPMYQPGDTVKYKAFVVKRNGKPVKETARLELQKYGSKSIKLGEVKPYRAGAYEGYFVLHDSLKLELDRQYFFYLYEQGSKREQYILGRFSYEDYELKENEYTLDLKHKEHQSGQGNSITGRGKNANGMNLLDARVELTVTTTRVVSSEQPVIFVPDTLWVHRQPLDAVGETTICIPDSIFPKASVNYLVSATFLNSSNERTVKSKGAKYVHTPAILNITLLQDSLLVQYRKGDLSKPKEAIITAYDPEYNDLSKLKATLPVRLPLNPYANGYDVRAGKLTDNLELTDKDAQITLQTARTNDSVYFSLQNPRKLPYWYFIYRGEQLVTRGQGNEVNYYTALKANSDKPYFVDVHYVWAGEVYKLHEAAPLNKHLLTIDLQTPQVVYPGQEASMKISVKDGKGKPLPGVDLIAYAVTSKFKNQNVPNLPTWSKYRPQKPVRKIALEEDEVTGRKLMDWEYWSSRMGLDSIAYYNFLYPGSGIFTEYATTLDSITQVSPFVVDSGRVVPVHVVYLDEVPVYFSKTDVLPAYAFAADSGYHTLKLRTTDKLITLDSVYLQHKHRLIISADITAAGNPYAQAAEKGKLSEGERRKLYGYLFYAAQNYDDNTAYFKQGNRIHLLEKRPHSFYSYQKEEKKFLMGPFSPNWMQYVRLSDFTTNFLMEPAYSYHFAPNLLKMREQQLPDFLHKLPLWNKGERSTVPLRQETLTEQRIHESWEKAQYEYLLGKLYTSNTSHTSKGKGRLGWQLHKDMEQQVKLVLLHKAGKPDSLVIYPRETAILYNLPPARYTLTLAFTNGKYVAANVAVKASGQTQLYFDSTDVKPTSKESECLLRLIDEKVKQLRKVYKEVAIELQQQLEAARQTTYSYTNGSEQFSNEITGVVTDPQSNMPLPGVVVLVKGTSVGTTTDASGWYTLYGPANGVLVFRYIGYSTQEENINNRERIDVKISPDVKQLQEVVVVGYGTQQRSAMTSSVATVLQGQAAGVAGSSAVIRIRGNSSINAQDAKPLLIVDGMPYSGSQVDIENVVSTNVLKGEQATALYGAAGAAGVIIITTKKGSSLANPEMPAQGENSIRNNFSDYAIWQPRLTTNKQGEATFTATFPDDITNWSTYVVGMDYKKRSGLYKTSIKSFKAMMATLHLPRFLVEGDKAYVVGKALNYLPDSAEVTTTFELGGKKIKEAKKLLSRSFTDTLHITAPAVAPDSLEVLYSLGQESGFADGERRHVQIYPKGVSETIGHFLPLYTDTTFTLAFDPAKGPVRLRTQGDLLEVMLEEIDYLYKYEYWCSEQAASKLKGLLLEKRIRKQLGQPFEHDRMVKRLIRHLEKTQLTNGAWTWWQEGPAYAWITSHVTEALVMAKVEGYTVKYKEQALADYLVQVMESGLYSDKLAALETLQQLNAKVDYTRYVQELTKQKRQSLEEQLRLTRLRQQHNMPVQLDTLQKYKKRTMLGGLFWGEPKYSLFNNSISNTLLAYRVLRAAGGYERELAQIRTYLLSERRNGHWRNTYESARTLEALLPDLLNQEQDKPRVEANTFSVAGAVNFEAKGFRSDTTFTATQPIQVKKQGNLPLYFTAYQTFWNRTPQPVEKDFIVKTSLKGMKADAVLKAGVPVEMLVEVEVKADADYVMIEVPIPASCSYDGKGGQGSYEVHREYYRDKVSIFSNRLPKGKYMYTIKLLPRYSGTYTINPAKAELMYFPTFYGREKLKQVTVK
ncbi:carboxypeptidase-like regulatory domain-containing protein [Pontibacter cellulosilyticus]|uniref:Carboxypeptidase-like regulatory domain-containing protein n=1 Tax=Pontibacter cellulosilyticus TaxID=1720253 RepID=A0A923NBN5_9BACT|nr:carboxypeptidase-like regulatory domain-containing protein [Pontibacter cellulosilyticus]MBC5994457.1 carboxypeptidase-like regulatory domain-containing protein [Pontibacter cellulosilyticus]